MTPATPPSVLTVTGTDTGVGRTIATAALASVDRTGGDDSW
jgi:dethiobiotin synthetase